MSATSARQAGSTRTPSPGFLLYAIGISVWMTLVSCTGSTYMLPLIPSGADAGLYVLPQQATYVAAYFIAAAIEWKRGPIKPASLMRASSISFAAAIACMIAWLLGAQGSVPLVTYGVCIGLGIAFGFMQWLRIVAERPVREIELLLVIASVVSIVSGALFCFVPLEGRFILFAAVLVPATIALLHANTHAIVDIAAKKRPADVAGGTKTLLTSLAVPTICAVVLVLVAPVASTTYLDTTGQDLFRLLLAQGANAAALAVLAVVLFGFNKKVSIFNAYCMLLPVLASSVLIASFFEPSQRWFVLFLGDACFCTVSLLMLLTSCSISKQLGVSTTIVYGLLGGFVYLARGPETLLIVPPAHPFDALAPFAIAALLLYILSIPAFFLPFLRKHADAGKSEPAKPVTLADLSAACESLARKHDLPARQREVLALLVSGHSVPHIADTLCLSQNTVKTYRKAIYATLNVHAKQELLDMVHEELGSA